MFFTKDASKQRIFIREKEDRIKKYGSIRRVIFHPSKPLVVGVIVDRPDLLLMVKRKERFVAFDRLEEVERGYCVVDKQDSWDAAACKRLGVQFDECIIWDYMPVRTESGTELGQISNIAIDEKTLEIDHIDISSGSVNRALLGSSDIPAEHIIGYREGAIVVSDEVTSIEESGGAAAKAGVAWAKTKHEAGQVAQKAGDAINDGAYKAGEAIGSVRDKASKAVEEHEAKKQEALDRGEYTGVDKAANVFGKQLGRASHMFKDFKEEFDKASRDD